MSWVRWLAPLLLALGVAWLVAGGGACGRGASPQLLQVSDVVPREIELGERLAILGEGFPPGKPARVTFRGILHRPGQRPEKGVEIAVPGVVQGPGRVEVAFTEATQTLFSGAGDRAAHTTFEGSIEVAFAAAVPGTPPVAGEMRHVVLDVRPGATAADVERDHEGQRVLSFLGLKASVAAAGLTVEAVEPGSRAGAAGIAAGDVLSSVDGVRVATLGDVVPAPGLRDAQVGLRRGGSATEVVRSVSVDGFRRAPPAELLAGALLVVAALAIVLLFAAPPLGGIAAAVSRVVARIRSRVGPSASPWAALGRSLMLGARDSMPPVASTAIVDATVCALLAALPFGQYLVAAQLDVGLLFVGAATALVVVALVSARSPYRGLRAAAHVAWQHAPAAGAVVSVVLATGSLRIEEIQRSQGGWPWDWLAFRSPGALVALLLLLGSALVEPDAEESFTGVLARVDDLDAGRTVPRSSWTQAACRAHRLVVAGLASTLFLGGWVIPGLSPAVQDARPLLELAGGAWLLAKTCAVVSLLAWARSALPVRTLAERSRVTAIALVPLSLCVLAATVAWGWWSPVRPAQLLVSGTLVAGAGLAAVALAQRLRHALGATPVDARLSPFL
ncbi:MAG TPA: NADH-quinone oxidoreductase subunit H [Polyangiaceae bacterium]|jgi:NADH-quinone oxidoreductase subunit H